MYLSAVPRTLWPEFCLSPVPPLSTKRALAADFTWTRDERYKGPWESTVSWLIWALGHTE